MVMMIIQEILQNELYMSFVEIIDFNALIDLSRQTNTTISQQNNFTGKLEEEDGATMFLIIEKQKIFFYLDSLIVAE